MMTMVDFSDDKAMQALMRDYAGYAGQGVNEDGEKTMTIVRSDSVELTTFQNNHWTRVDTYWSDGTIEYGFDGRW